MTERKKIIVRFVPTTGQSRTEEVRTPEASLESILTSANVSGKGHQISVDGKPVTDLKTVVSAGAVVVVTERARGS